MSREDISRAGQQAATLEECRAALVTAQQEAADLRDKYLRAAAGLDNTRKQAERDAEQRANQRLRSVFGRLLAVVDNLDRALAHAAEGDSIRPGVEAILQQFLGVLRQEGVIPIEVEVGATFDPQIHEAITTQEGDVDHAMVVAVMQRGFTFDGQVLRPAGVVVTIPARTTP